MTKQDDMAVFDKARVLFRKYGTVLGLPREFANFKKKHKDWREVLPLLEPAIRSQIKQRKIDGRFWKHFQTWINGGCWEEESPERACGVSPEQGAEVLRVTELTKVAAEERAKERRLNARKYRRNSLQAKE